MAQEYLTGRAHPALAGIVTRYQGYREHSGVPVRRRQAPSGACPLILGFDGALSLDGPSGRSRPTAFLAGMHRGAVVTEFTGDQAGVQVDLTPLGVFRLLACPMDGLTDAAPELDALGSPELARLPARLAEDPDWPTRFARVDRALLGLLSRSRARPSPEVAHAWSALRASDGGVPVTRLAEETGWSRRHLLTRFREQVGLAPKPAGRVLRFARASSVVLAAPETALADVAATCGYADHAHLDREFRALAGCTPTRFVAEWR